MVHDAITGETGTGSLEYELRLWDRGGFPDGKYLSIHVRGAQALPVIGQRIELLAPTSFEVVDVSHPLPLDSEDLEYAGLERRLNVGAYMPIVKAK